MERSQVFNIFRDNIITLLGENQAPQTIIYQPLEDRLQENRRFFRAFIKLSSDFVSTDSSMQSVRCAYFALTLDYLG